MGIRIGVVARSEVGMGVSGRLRIDSRGDFGIGTGGGFGIVENCNGCKNWPNGKKGGQNLVEGPAIFVYVD